MKFKKFLAPAGKQVRLDDYDSSHKGGYKSHASANSRLRKNTKLLEHYQDLLYSENSYSLLIVLQAMDAAGKDGTVQHVMSGVNPAGCDVTNFKQPSTEELAHDFLWRCNRALPARGKIGIFNRSYYEEVLVVRVHPDLLQQQHLPDFKRPDKQFWKQRFESINDLERHLVRNGTIVLKFYLNVSRQEQEKRFLARLDQPDKNWKFSNADLQERLHWDEYIEAYESMLSHTSTEHAPWYIIPADHKWFAHLCVSDIIVKTLRDLHLHYPVLTDEHRARLRQARASLKQ